MGKIAGPPGGWYFWNLAGINHRDVQAMPAPEHVSRVDGKITKVIVALEIQAAVIETDSVRLGRILRYLPTAPLRRECRSISRAEANCAKMIRAQVSVLRHLQN